MHRRGLAPPLAAGCWTALLGPTEGFLHQQFSFDLSEGVLLLSRCTAGETEAQGKHLLFPEIPPSPE